MQTQTIASSTKDILQSSRKAAVNVIQSGHNGTRSVLKACDQIIKAGADRIAEVPPRRPLRFATPSSRSKGQATLSSPTML